MSVTTQTILADISTLLTSHIKCILSDISKTYGISKDELLERYMPTKEDKNKKDDEGGLETAALTASVEPKKKRGRKKKQKDEFISTEEYEFEGEKYLVDGQNNVYTHNIEEPMLVGERLVDGTIKFFEAK